MKLLVIGGTGLLGNKLIELAEGRFEIYSTYHTHEIDSPDSYKLDVTDHNATREIIEEINPGAVVNTAAFHLVDKCETDMDIAKAINVDAAVNIAQVCSSIDSHSVYISTEYVFDGLKGSAYSEEDKPNPLGYYGKTKLMAEREILETNGDNMIARTSVVYGWNDTKLNFATWAISELEKGHPVKIVDDQVGSPTLSDNLAEGILKAVELRKTGIYHLGGGEAIDRYRFTLILADVFGFDRKLVEPIKTHELNQMAKRPLYAPLDVSKAEKELEIKMLSAREGLELMKTQEG